jgi:hypothetical protein
VKPDPTQAAAEPATRRAAWLWGAAALLGAALLLGLHGWSLERTWIEPSQIPVTTGVAGRTQWGGLIPEFSAPPRIFLDNDCYYWIRYAQQMVRTGNLRVRHTDLDNVPEGRAVHWSSSFSWWLLLCGGAESLLTGRSWSDSIEPAALWSNTALFLLILAAGGCALARTLGGPRTALLILLLAALPGLQWAFGYGRPGHHGLHSLAALGGLLCVVLGGAGWVRVATGIPACGIESSGQTGRQGRLPPHRPPDRASALRWFTAGGFFGGFGLWIGATQQLVVFGCIGVAAVLATLLARPREDATWDGTLWRRWGTAAALTSLFFYLLEYFPGWPAMRLEVNHPLYAAAFFAGGEFLARLAVWRAGRTTPTDRLILGSTLLVMLLVPAALLLGPRAWHALRDPYMRRLHDHIMNFQPFITGVDAGAWFKLLREFALLPLLLPVAGWLLWRRRAADPAGAVLLLAFVPAVVLGGWTLYQSRWSNLFSPALAVLLLVLWRETADGSPLTAWSRRLLPWLGLGPLVAMLAFGWVQSRRQAEAHLMDPYLGWSIASRDMAFNLKRLAQLGPVRVMSGPGQTPSLHFFGGGQGMGSLYWENIAGVRAAADFFADLGEADAKRIARERGITHVVVQQDPVLASQMFWVKNGREAPVELPKTLAWRLADPLSRPPDWLEPVPYYGSPAASDYQMRIYRVRLAALGDAK